MKWFKYDTLYVNGSSLTAGGGLGNSDIKEEYKKLYNLEWTDEKNVTYPKYVADYFGLKLIHKALCGSGAPRLVRETYEYIINEGIDKAKKTIFLLEITDPIHRVDVYCNQINDYVIANVRYDNDYSYDSKISSIQIQRAVTKHGDIYESEYFEGKISDEIKDYLNKYHNPVAYTEKYYGEVAGLLSFMKQLDLTFFYMFNEHTLKNVVSFFYNDIKNHEIRIDGHNCINQFAGINKLTIKDELNGASSDLHPGYFGNKQFSEKLIPALEKLLKPKVIAFGDSHTQSFLEMCNSKMSWAVDYVNYIKEIPKNYIQNISEHFDNLEIDNYGRGGISNQTIFDTFISNKHNINPKDILIFGWTTESRFRISNESNSFVDIIPFSAHPKQNDDVSKITTDEIAVNKLTYNVWWTEIMNYIKIIEDLFPNNLIYHWTWVNNKTQWSNRLWSEEMLNDKHIIVVKDDFNQYEVNYREIILDNAEILYDFSKNINDYNIHEDFKKTNKIIIINFNESNHQHLNYLTKNNLKVRYLTPTDYKKTCYEKFIPYKKYNTIYEETNGAVDDLHTSRTGHQELAKDLLMYIESDIKQGNNKKNVKISLL